MPVTIRRSSSTSSLHESLYSLPSTTNKRFPSPWELALERAYFSLCMIAHQTPEKLSAEFQKLEERWAKAPAIKDRYFGTEEEIAAHTEYMTFHLNKGNPLYRHTAIKGPFVHASRVATPEQCYIACERPSEDPYRQNFWHMVFEEKPPFILNLIEDHYQRKPLCYLFANSDDDPYRIETNYNEREQLGTGLHKFRVCITRKSDGKVYLLNYLHYYNWPDAKIPKNTPEEFLALIDHLNKELANLPPESAPIVHCLAGKGRTGTLILIHSLIRPLEKERFLDQLQMNLMEALDCLRQQRWGMVQTVDQYLFVWKVITAWYQREQKGIQKYHAFHSLSSALSLGTPSALAVE